MNLLTRQVPLPNWAFALAKVGFICFGIIVGAVAPAFWMPLIWPLGVIGVVTLGWATILWFKGMSRPAISSTRPV